MGKGLHERYYYCINIAYISAILWGYVLIWYTCGDGVFLQRSLDSFFYVERILIFDEEIINAKYLLPRLLPMCYIMGR